MICKHWKISIQTLFLVFREFSGIRTRHWLNLYNVQIPNNKFRLCISARARSHSSRASHAQQLGINLNKVIPLIYFPEKTFVEISAIFLGNREKEEVILFQGQCCWDFYVFTNFELALSIGILYHLEKWLALIYTK